MSTTAQLDHLFRTRHSVQMPMSAAMDLSATGGNLDVFHAFGNYNLVGYRLLYTEASSDDTGGAISIGRYQNNVAVDVDYFDTSTSETEKPVGYYKEFSLSDLTNSLVTDGDTITCTWVQKTGVGIIKVVLLLIPR